jgi:hypothetical protein
MVRIRDKRATSKRINLPPQRRNKAGQGPIANGVLLHSLNGKVQLPRARRRKCFKNQALRELPWKTYVLLPRFKASQSHALKATPDQHDRKTGRTHLFFLMR